MDITFHELLFFLVIFIANTFEAMTGFAGTLLAMPASMILIGVDEAKTILNIIALITCSFIVFSNFKKINKKEFLKITSFMIVGVLLGLLLFDYLEAAILMKIYAVVIIAIALKNMFVKTAIKQLPFFLSVAILLLAGVIHGMFLSGGSLLIIYAMIVLREKSEFRATLAAIWVVLDSGILLNQFLQGYVTTTVVSLTALSIIPLFIAIALGNYLHKKMKQEHFLKVTYVLLFISGITLLIK